MCMCVCVIYKHFSQCFFFFLLQTDMQQEEMNESDDLNDQFESQNEGNGPGEAHVLF